MHVCTLDIKSNNNMGAHLYVGVSLGREYLTQGDGLYNIILWDHAVHKLSCTYGNSLSKATLLCQALVPEVLRTRRQCWSCSWVLPQSFFHPVPLFELNTDLPEGFECQDRTGLYSAETLGIPGIFFKHV